MDYEGNIIRPPSEANSIILQVTVGCSHNACTFCGAYRDKKFRIKEEAAIRQDLEFAARYCRRQKTLFLADGNALTIPQPRMVQLLSQIREMVPQVRRVGMYANSNDILRRSPEEFQVLKNLGLKRIYMGLESGHRIVLDRICKGAEPAEMIEAGSRIREAGIFLSVTVLLGIGGTEYSQEHARATAEVLNRMQPNQIAVLTLMILQNTPLGRQYVSGRFQLPDRQTLFSELRTLLTCLDVPRAQFQANHASNYFTLAGRLPRDREKLINRIERAIDGSVTLKPESFRAL
ncbi:MAG: radical SAM protein [Desulfobulbaceae bacterium]|nr:radical SAM protein [Desulfobulbaceae bacterium]